MKLDNTQTVIWDLDGTLLDSFGIFSEVLREAAATRKLFVPEDTELAKHFHGSLRDSIASALGGLSGKLLDDVEADFLSFQNKHYEVLEHHLFQDSLRLAQVFHKHGFTQIIVTNRDHEGRLNASPRSIVEKSSLAPLISHVIAGDDGRHRKPEMAVLGDYQLQGKTIVVGDQFVDIAFAYNLGVDAIIVNRSGEGMHGVDSLTHDWQSHTRVVTSLDEITTELG